MIWIGSLASRFGKRLTSDLKEIHEIEERRPIDTIRDVTTVRDRLCPQYS